MKNPIEKLREIAAGKITAIVLRKMGDGTFPVLPRQAKWIYDHLDGLNTWSGAALLTVVGAIEAAQRSGLCALLAGVWPVIDCAAAIDHVQYAIASLGAFFLYIGQVNGGLKTAAPGMMQLTNYTRYPPESALRARRAR